jgi:hypothetical protein
VAWFGHEGVVFWASFSDARFAAFGSYGEQVLGEDEKDLAEDSGLYSRAAMGGIDDARPLAKRVD